MRISSANETAADGKTEGQTAFLELHPGGRACKIAETLGQN